MPRLVVGTSTGSVSSQTYSQQRAQPSLPRIVPLDCARTRASILMMPSAMMVAQAPNTVLALWALIALIAECACRNFGNYSCIVVVILVVDYTCLAFLCMHDSSSSYRLRYTTYSRVYSSRRSRLEHVYLKLINNSMTRLV